MTTTGWAAGSGAGGSARLASFVRDRYWPAVRGRLSPAWQARTEDLLAELVDDLGAQPVAALTVETMAQWWARVQERHRSPTTANKVLARARHVLGTACAWGLVASNPLAPARRLPEPRGRVRFLTPDERDRLVASAGTRLRWWILWGLYTGARRGSLWALQQGDIDLARGSVTFRHVKVGEPYVIPLHPVLAWTAPLRLTGEAARPLLPRYADPAIVSRLFRRLCQREGLTGVSFHTLRHDVGARLGMAGTNQRAIMDILGHRDPRMSVRYTHLSMEALRGVVERL